MKRSKILVCVAVLLLSAFALSSCGMLEEMIDTGKKELTIIYPDTTETVEVVIDKVTDLEPKYKTGKVLMGYYETEEATGIRYFDAYGVMAGEWKEHYPDELYAVYEDIDYEYVFKSKVGADEDPQTLKGGVIVGASFWEIDFGKVKDEKDNEYLKMVLDQNSYLDVTVKAHVMVKSDTKSTVTMKLRVGAEDLATTSIATGSGKWESGSVSARVSVKQFYGDNSIYTPIKFDATGALSAPQALIKNVYYTVSFVQPQA